MFSTIYTSQARATHPWSVPIRSVIGTIVKRQFSVFLLDFVPVISSAVGLQTLCHFTSINPLQTKRGRHLFSSSNVSIQIFLFIMKSFCSRRTKLSCNYHDGGFHVIWVLLLSFYWQTTEDEVGNELCFYWTQKPIFLSVVWRQQQQKKS